MVYKRKTMQNTQQLLQDVPQTSISELTVIIAYTVSNSIMYLCQLTFQTCYFNVQQKLLGTKSLGFTATLTQNSFNQSSQSQEVPLKLNN